MKRGKFVNLKNSLYFKSRTDFLKYALNGMRGNLLDVGNLGDGIFNVNVESIVEKNRGKYWGLDCNKNLSEKLKRKNQYIGDLHNLNNVINNEQFDYVYAGEVIEHTWSPGKMINECNRILKPGGILILDTPNVFSFRSILRFVFKKMDTVGMDDNRLAYNEAKDNFYNFREVKSEILSQPQHKIFYSPAMLRQLLNMHGFKIEKYIFIKKECKKFYLSFLFYFFPQCGEKIGIIARKEELESIFQV